VFPRVTHDAGATGPAPPPPPRHHTTATRAPASPAAPTTTAHDRPDNDPLARLARDHARSRSVEIRPAHSIGYHHERYDRKT
jgi:hypothetical protein